jgi:quinol monooxygenase YgiN
LACRPGFDRVRVQIDRQEALMFVAVAIHHPEPEYVEEFLAFMDRVRAAASDAPGLIEFRTWRDTLTNRLVGLSRWESDEAFSRAMPQIMSLSHERRPEWSAQPDDLLLLTTP